jgi:hypothetical protein
MRAVLGERERSIPRLERAVEAYRAVVAFHAALEVFELAGADYYLRGTRTNLARAEHLLAERRSKLN